MVLTVLLSLISAVPTVVDSVAELMAVDAAVVATTETEWRLTFNIHCKVNKGLRLYSRHTGVQDRARERERERETERERERERERVCICTKKGQTLTYIQYLMGDCVIQKCVSVCS